MAQGAQRFFEFGSFAIIESNPANRCFFVSFVKTFVPFVVKPKTAVESGSLAEPVTASALSAFVRRTNRCAFTKP
jgi:hypothetical protein